MSKRVWIVVGFLILGVGCKKGEKKEAPVGGAVQVMELQSVVAGKKVLMVIAPKDFRDEEYIVPKEMLEKQGVVITTASTVVGEARGVNGASAKVDKLVKDVNSNEYDGVIFVGGPGTPVLYDNPDVQRIAKEMFANGKVVGAICLAPVILARAGLLTEKVSTVFPSAKGELEKINAKYQATEVAIDGRIVTASGPEAASKFANAILKILSTK